MISSIDRGRIRKASGLIFIAHLSFLYKVSQLMGEMR
jgi:hypothetical protein